MTASLVLLVHANSKVGKSWLADTAPGPRLILDAEGGTKWTKSHKIKWDPKGPPPTGLSATDSVVVRVLSFQDLMLAKAWLESGNHEFKSVIVDSVTEAQYKCQLAIAGANAMEMQDWGKLLRDMLTVCTSFRDLPDHPTNPLECVVFITGSLTTKEGAVIPDLQGQLQRKLPYIVDVIGYLFTQTDSAGVIQRGMLVQPVAGQPLAGDRTDVLSLHYGTVIPHPSLPAMLEVMNGALNA